MSAALGIVRGHGGGLQVFSEPGQGTTFKVLLPVTTEPAQEPKPPGPAVEAWKGAGTVLLADDEPMIQRVAKLMLQRLGFSVLVASDGKEALELYQAHRKEIVCVLLDLTMPRMDGGECFQRLRKLNPSVCVLMTSGYEEQEVTQRIVGKGLAGFVQKPFRMEALQRKVKSILS